MLNGVDGEAQAYRRMLLAIAQATRTVYMEWYATGDASMSTDAAPYQPHGIATKRLGMYTFILGLRP
jgi:hypothetical protein